MLIPFDRWFVHVDDVTLKKQLYEFIVWKLFNGQYRYVVDYREKYIFILYIINSFCTIKINYGKLKKKHRSFLPKVYYDKVRECQLLLLTCYSG